MGRKTKIRISAAAVVLGVVTWVFWPELVQGEVRIIFVGLSSNDSHRASFVITNSSKNSVRYYMGWQEEKRGVWQQPDVWTRDNTREIPGQSTENFELPGYYMARWRPVVDYYYAQEATWKGRIRLKLAFYAWKHGWQRISKWLSPLPKFTEVYGPEMFGNQPAPPARQ